MATMKRPAVGGNVVHDGEVVGKLKGESILDERTYNRLRALFASRKRGRVAGLAYIGTGILRCGMCGMKLTARRCSDNPYLDGTPRSQYFCAKDRRGCGKVAVDRPKVDAELLAFTVERLSDERHAAQLASAITRTNDRLHEVSREITEIEQLQRNLSERLGQRKLTLAAFDAANDPLALDLARLTAERDSLSAEIPGGWSQASSAVAIEAAWQGET